MAHAQRALLLRMLGVCLKRPGYASPILLFPLLTSNSTWKASQHDWKFVDWWNCTNKQIVLTLSCWASNSKFTAEKWLNRSQHMLTICSTFCASSFWRNQTYVMTKPDNNCISTFRLETRQYNESGIYIIGLLLFHQDLLLFHQDLLLSFPSKSSPNEKYYKLPYN